MPWKKGNKGNFPLRYCMVNVPYILDIPRNAGREELAIFDEHDDPGNSYQSTLPTMHVIQ